MGLRVKGAWILLGWVLWSVVPAWAGIVTVAWDPNPPGEEVEGYVVCYGATSRHDTGVPFDGYDHEVYVGAVTFFAQVPDAAPDGGNLYVAVVARNNLGLRSDYSTELTVFPDAGLVGQGSGGDGTPDAAPGGTADDVTGDAAADDAGNGADFADSDSSKTGDVGDDSSSGGGDGGTLSGGVSSVSGFPGADSGGGCFFDVLGTP